MIPDYIIGPGKKKDINKLFLNNSAPLFLAGDPSKLKDDELPVVASFSGLSRNQRKKNPTWAFDPNLTRARMASAQEILARGVNNLRLLDQTSHLENLIEEMKDIQFDKSQTDFVIPKPGDPDHYLTNKKDAIEKALKLDDFIKYAEQHNIKTDGEEKEVKKSWADSLEDEEEFGMDQMIAEGNVDEESKEGQVYEDALEEVADDISTPPTSVKSMPTERSMENHPHAIMHHFPGYHQKKGSHFNQKKNFKERVERPKKEHQQKGRWKSEGYGYEHPAKIRDQHTQHVEFQKEPREFNIFKRACSRIFDQANVNIHGDHEDNLIFLYHKYEGMIDDPMIEMYVAGIQKERQASLSKRHENIVNTLASTASALGKQLEILKESNKVQRYLNESSLRSHGDSESDVSSQVSQQTEQRVSYVKIPKSEANVVYHPLPLKKAPKAAQPESQISGSMSHPGAKRSISKPIVQGNKGKEKEEHIDKKKKDSARMEYKPKQTSGRGIVINEPSEDQKRKNSPSKDEKSHASTSRDTRSIGVSSGSISLSNKTVNTAQSESLDDLSNSEIISLALLNINAPESLLNPVYTDILGELMDREQWIPMVKLEDSAYKAKCLGSITGLLMELED